MYYTARERLRHMMDTRTIKMPLNTNSADEYAAWKTAFRKKLAELLGLSLFERCPPNPQTLETKQMDGYSRIKMTIDTEPGVTMPLYMLVPDGPPQKRPAVLALHGHGSCGKEAVVGNGTFAELEEKIQYYNYDYGVQAAKLGFVAFCPDARGFGERREQYFAYMQKLQGDNPELKLKSSCLYLNTMGMGLGTNTTGMWTWELMRLLDYVQSREDIIADSIGCIGLSGGGLQTLWLTAMDDRIKCAVISGYFYGFGEALQEELCCNCNYVPHLWEYCDVGEIGALIAPRPLLIETGTQDRLNGASNLDNVVPYVNQVREAYKLLCASDHLYHDIFQGHHRWNGVHALPWINKHLK